MYKLHLFLKTHQKNNISMKKIKKSLQKILKIERIFKEKNKINLKKK